MIDYINSLENDPSLEVHFDAEITLAKKINEIIHYLNTNEIHKDCNKHEETLKDVQRQINNLYIGKEKIRDKIKEIHDYTFMSLEEREKQDYAISKLEELLED